MPAERCVPAADSGVQTIGIGQVRTFSGTDSMQMQQMQMITGNSSLLTTHWASMAQDDPNTFVPPSLASGGTLLSPVRKRTDATAWRLQSDDLFGPEGIATVVAILEPATHAMAVVGLASDARSPWGRLCS